MHANNIAFTARAVFFIMKGALHAHDLDMELKYFNKLKVTWMAHSTSEPIVPHSIMMLLVELAWEVRQLGRLVLELRGAPVPEKIVDAMLAKCVQSSGSSMARSVEALARADRATLPDSTYSLLIKVAMTSTPLRARGIVEEVLARKGSGFSPDLAVSVLDFCTATSDTTTADQLFGRMKPRPVNIITAFIWFYIYVEDFEKACDVYELDMLPACSCADGSIALDANLQESLVDAAVLCGRTHLAESLIAEPRLALASQVRQLIDTVIVVIARWNAVVSYWVVLVF